MFKQLTELVANLLFLVRDTRENKEAIERLRHEMHELASTVEKLSFEVQRISDREKLERETGNPFHKNVCTLNMHFHRVKFDFLSEAPEARQIVAHGETVGQRPQTNQAPARGDR